MLQHVVLCCIMLFSAASCCSLLHSVPCCNMLCCAATCCPMLQHVVLCCNILSYAVSCCAVLQHVVLCCIMLCSAATWSTPAVMLSLQGPGRRCARSPIAVSRAVATRRCHRPRKLRHSNINPHSARHSTYISTRTDVSGQAIRIAQWDRGFF